MCPLMGRLMVRDTSSLEYGSLSSRPFSWISDREANDLVMFLVVGSRMGPKYSADTAFICAESRGSICERVCDKYTHKIQHCHLVVILIMAEEIKGYFQIKIKTYLYFKVILTGRQLHPRETAAEQTGMFKLKLG